MSREFPNFTSESKEGKKLKEPWEMSYNEFSQEYEIAMKTAQRKEKNPGEAMTEQEKQLIEKDWKEFSRQRGYSEADIAEYERWWVLSGQRDFEDAINDPWRRMRGGREQELYVRHIQHALDSGKLVPAPVLEEFERVKKTVQSPRGAGSRDIPNIPSAVETNTEKEEDVW